MKLYVGGLPYSATEQELNDFFAAEGKVVSAVIINDKFSGKSKGFGFVEFEDATEGKNAVNNLNGKDFGGRSITVNEARPREERRPGGDRNFGGNSRPRY